MYQKNSYRRASGVLCLFIGGMLAVGNSWAQSAPLTLSQAFEAAWSRQPEAQSLTVRLEAAEARRQSSTTWTPEQPTLEVSAKTDQLNRNQGSREYAAGVALPLWLPGVTCPPQSIPPDSSRSPSNPGE